ncbi:MAG TPA: RNA polymerase sigma factor [Vicinamibacterales bacterium]|nr:RNA polymerase sigma factor [Vicinamibacterales bacterium]
MADVEDQDPPDALLLARAAAGDRNAFAALYRRRRPDVYRFALLMSGSASVADDVTQDVFMEVIRHAGRYQPERAGVVPWLFGIARNCVLRTRERQRPVVPVDDIENGSRALDLAVVSDPLAGMARRQHIAALRRALLGLPAKYREVIVLCDLQELSYADAAASLRCALGTVRSRLHRGRAMLAARLAHTEALPERGAKRRIEGWLL